MNRTRRLSVAMGAAGLLAVSSIGSVAAQDSVSVQLQWTPQAQFAGFYAADQLGYWDELGLEVNFLDGAPDIVPQLVGSDPNGPEFTMAWVPKVLEAREGGSDLVNIAQTFQKSGILSVSWADAPVNSPEEFAGKNVGVWGFGNEFEVTAAATQAGLEADVDYVKVIQPFDMSLLLNREVDTASAMTYNEYAQVLETINPDTGEVYQPEDLVVIDYNAVGTAMLQDAVHARAAWLAEEGNEDIAVRFIAGLLKGWAYCRDNPADCVQFSVDAGSLLGAGHQAWMMNEINALIWPSPNGAGAMDQDFWEQTVRVALESGVIQAEPDEGAVRSDLLEAAWELIGDDVDLVGADFQKDEITLTEGGA